MGRDASSIALQTTLLNVPAINLTLFYFRLVNGAGHFVDCSANNTPQRPANKSYAFSLEKKARFIVSPLQRQDFPSPMWQGSSTSCLLRSNSLYRWSTNRNQQLDLLPFQLPQRPRILLLYRCPYRNIWIPPLRNRNSSFRCPSFPTLGRTTVHGRSR